MATMERMKLSGITSQPAHGSMLNDVSNGVGLRAGNQQNYAYATCYAHLTAGTTYLDEVWLWVEWSVASSSNFVSEKGGGTTAGTWEVSQNAAQIRMPAYGTPVLNTAGRVFNNGDYIRLWSYTGPSHQIWVAGYVNRITT